MQFRCYTTPCPWQSSPSRIPGKGPQNRPSSSSQSLAFSSLLRFSRFCRSFSLCSDLGASGGHAAGCESARPHQGEVALLEILDGRVLGQELLESLPKVLDEYVLGLHNLRHMAPHMSTHKKHTNAPTRSPRSFDSYGVPLTEVQ